jgi:hypothetical protein
MLDRQQSKSDRTTLHTAWVISAFLIKFAKHLALIASLLIAGRSMGRLAVTQLDIFLTILSAALLHSIGQVLQRRLSVPAGVTRSEP